MSTPPSLRPSGSQFSDGSTATATGPASATGPAASMAGFPIASADPCVHCGFCLPTCASYRVLGTEMDSPRGRIHALRAIQAGELELDATVAKHFDSCLGCFACVTACPSGVRYDELIEAARPLLNAPELRNPAQRAFRGLLFALLPYPQRLRALLAPLRSYAGTPLQALARRTGLTRLFGPQIAAMERLLPALPPEAFPGRLARGDAGGGGAALPGGAGAGLRATAVRSSGEQRRRAGAERQRHRGGDPPVTRAAAGPSPITRGRWTRPATWPPS
jgi:NAD-dependent dihydropyrimidine dehydrogenase PreA subunit